MSDAVIVGLLSAGTTLIGYFVTNIVSQRKQDKDQDDRTQAIKQELTVQTVKMEELTREVREHNNFALRMPVVEEQIKDLRKRIEKLESLERSRP